MNKYGDPESAYDHEYAEQYRKLRELEQPMTTETPDSPGDLDPVKPVTLSDADRGGVGAGDMSWFLGCDGVYGNGTEFRPEGD